MSTNIEDYPTLITFGVLGGVSVINTGASTVQGNVGVSGGTQSAITGFNPPGTATGTIQGTDTPGSTTIAAKTELLDLLTAINGLTKTTIPTELGGTTLSPGAYTAGTFSLNGTLTLTGGPTDQYFFIAMSTFMFAASSKAVINYGNVDPKNIFWVGNGSITVYSTGSSALVGYLLAKQSISIQANTSDFGGVYASNATVTMDTNIITQAVVCYVEGTKICTDHGNVPIEDLEPGDIVLSMGNIDDLEHVTKFVCKPIVWKSKFTTSSQTKEGCPICIKAHAFGDAPFEDLYVSPRHRIVVGDNLVEARALVNGSTIVQEYAHDRVTYYHIELDTHSSIFANGLLSESFLNVNNRIAFESAPKCVTPMSVS